MHKFLIPLLLVLFSACSSTPSRSAQANQQSSAINQPNDTANVDLNDVAVYALSLSDTPYHYGGNTPESGFDCSGFVRHVFQHTLGMSLPRTSHEMSRIGEAEKLSRLQPGDLVFYNTMRKANSHVGIYLGEGKFVHSPRAGSSVRVENMNETYWVRRYNGARRLKNY